MKRREGIVARVGFTNFLAVLIIALLFIGLTGGFALAWRSISTGYVGSLVCWTVVFTPIGTACSVVLSRIVDKSRAENVSNKNGTGIKFAIAMKEYEKTDWQSPNI